MRIVMFLVVFLGLQGCDNRTGIKKAGVDASSEVASPSGAPTNDSGSTTEVGAPLAPPDTAPIVFPDAHSEQIGAPGPCYAFGSPVAKLSVQEVLDDAAGLDTSSCMLVNVPGTVFEDIRQKRADSPAPVQSLFILQDGGELPGYTTSAPRPYIQLYSVHGLSPPMHRQVHVAAILRVVAVAEGNGPPAPFPYLEVLLFTLDQNAPDGSTDQANGSADGKTEARETPAGASFELRDDPSGVAADAGPCSPGFIRTWVMEFSADARTVKVIPVSAVRSVPVNGSLSDAPDPILHYGLNDAAGELLVWRQGNAWFAQLTRFGSGPEAGCVRGELILQAPL